jgi:hypothetical protein
MMMKAITIKRIFKRPDNDTAPVAADLISDAVFIGNGSR